MAAEVAGLWKALRAWVLEDDDNFACWSNGGGGMRQQGLIVNIGYDSHDRSLVRL